MVLHPGDNLGPCQAEVNTSAVRCASSMNPKEIQLNPRLRKRVELDNRLRSGGESSLAEEKATPLKKDNPPKSKFLALQVEGSAIWLVNPPI